jgi:N-acylglucosamine 2-epimerase
MNFKQLRQSYFETLVADIVPFWVRHAIDANRGINTCLTDEGRLLSRDRWSWSQWRAVWTFARLYNQIEPQTEWIEIAEGIQRSASNNGPLPNGHWPLLLDGEGHLLRGYESIYSDGFAIYGLTELWRATRRNELLDLALATFDATEKAFSGNEPPPAWPYPIEHGRMAHGISMLFSLAYHELAEATGEARVRQAALRHHQLVMDKFLRPDRGLVLEWLDLSGSEIQSPDGTVVLPGHAIESMWFQIHIAKAADDNNVISRAVETIRQHLEIGWDKVLGGLFLAVDADGREDVAWRFHDAKLWWPHAEALYATLLAYEYTGEAWCLEWHDRIRGYSFAHYPVSPHGEWRQKLDRHGRPIQETVALPVKDPFHLPRALIYCIDVLDRLIMRAGPAAS